ncbi:MAG: SDR family oxidoreductase [Candidatus Heimdallarchaeota archaeon]|nr:SDR family oxidoreductase [Candidatus Heimdallarchaeota archaeon]MDH5646540.1 SDR family oxidoreductase [Candidatus Heimdallarchaeota archaeon]
MELGETGDFSGKTVLITGAGTGIGRATALYLADKMASVSVADIDEVNGLKTVDLINNRGGNACFIHVDVASESSVQQMVEQTVAIFGKLDYAFNNAGISGNVGLVHEIEDDWQKVIDVNLSGVYYAMKHEVRQFIEQRSGGVIINTSSILGLVGSSNVVAYTASKHGVMGLTKSFAKMYVKQGIRVLAINPGYIDTPLLDKAGLVGNRQESDINALASIVPMKRLGSPEEVAKLVAFLFSSSYLTGTNVVIDGGMLA